MSTVTARLTIGPPAVVDLARRRVDAGPRLVEDELPLLRVLPSTTNPVVEAPSALAVTGELDADHWHATSLPSAAVYAPLRRAVTQLGREPSGMDPESR